MPLSPSNQEVAQALVDFSTSRSYPEDDKLPEAYVKSELLPVALEVLGQAKNELETEIRQISRDSASDVDEWIRNAKGIHDDIEKSRKLASSIVRQAEEDEEQLTHLKGQQGHVQLLSIEIDYRSQLLACLQSLKEANELLRKVELQASEHRIVDALHTLAEAFPVIAKIPLEKTTRAVRLLDTRAFELRATIQDQTLKIWHNLIKIKVVDGTASLTIREVLKNEPTSLNETVIALKSFKELDTVAKKLCEDFDTAILLPRTKIGAGPVPAIVVAENVLSLGPGTVDRTIKSLFTDIETIIQFLSSQLPSEIVDLLSRRMMPDLTTRLLDDWLDTAIPSSLDDMVDYQKALALVSDFAVQLESMSWPGGDSLLDWVSNAPKIWLNKRRETALDWTRNQLSIGLGDPQLASRTETRMVKDDEVELPSPVKASGNDDWDSAWDGDEPEVAEPNQNGSGPGKNRGSIEEERRNSEISDPSPLLEEEDDAADAWGWNEDDATEEDAPTVEPPAKPITSSLLRQISSATREVTISEKYWTSSLPKPVLATVLQMYDDGAQLMRSDSSHLPVAPAAPGLFALPTLILAMYRAVSLHYYTSFPGGNMYLYNDAVWLAERLTEFIATWTARTDLTPRAHASVRLDSEIKVLESFGKRAYTTELIAQRTIINDLLNGAQNFFTQTTETYTLADAIAPVLSHIRNQATVFSKILTYSAYSSAIGSLVNALASKLIDDIFDLTDIGVDEAERIATVISQVETLDDLFSPRLNPSHPLYTKRSSFSESPNKPTPLSPLTPSNLNLNTSHDKDDEIPLTPQFAPLWLKMKFLSEVLQSNLKDVKFLWFESDLSLYFTATEVVDLIGLSFELNAQVRAVVREIKERPDPKGLGASGVES